MLWKKNSPVTSVLLSGCLFAGLMGLVGCDKPGQAPKEQQVTDVGIIEIVPEKAIYTTELAGRTTAFQVSEVRPQVSGIIQKRLFKEGADVKAGETLYQIDPSVYKAELDSARANLARSEANVVPAQLKMKRFKDLVNISAVSKQEYEDAEAAYKQAQADVNVNKAQVETARIRLDYTKVRSPISGRIGRSSITAGALVTENQAQALASIQQLNPIYIDVTQSSTEVLRLRRSLESGRLQRTDEDHATVKLLLEDGTPYAQTGTLQFAEVTVDESTGMVTLRALFPNPEQELLPGMYVRTILNEGIDEQAILLPQKALMRDAKGNPFVYVATHDNKVETRSIKAGRTYGDSWIVTEGLAAGDKVLVDGLQKIRPGASIRPIPAQAATTPTQTDSPK